MSLTKSMPAEPQRQIAFAVVLFSAVVLGSAIALLESAIGKSPIPLLGAYLGMTALGAWLASRYLIPLSVVPTNPKKLALVPVAVLGFGGAFLASGPNVVGPFWVHQVAWALIGVVTVIVIAATGGLRGTVPIWLIVMLGLLLILQLPLEGGNLFVLFNLGIVGIALFVAWNTASSGGGSVVRFLGYVSFAYWLLTAIAVLVALSHVSIGNLTPGTITPPWAAGLNENRMGYGFITAQFGRILTVVVGVYHLVRLRLGQRFRLIHAGLCALATLVFLTEYGRIPLIGAIVAVGIAMLLLFPRGRVATSTLGLAIVGALVAIGLLTSGTSSGAFSLRLGTYNWDSGHLLLWNQQLSLFVTAPVAGVSTHPSDRQLYEASLLQVIPTRALTVGSEVTAQDLAVRGPRGEGGWTGLVAQDGIVGASILMSLLVVAARGLLRSPSAFPADVIEDRILLRSLLPATFIWYLTDIQVAGFTTFADYVVLQLTMFAVAHELSVRRHSLRSPSVTGSMGGPTRSFAQESRTGSASEATSVGLLTIT